MQVKSIKGRLYIEYFDPIAKYTKRKSLKLADNSFGWKEANKKLKQFQSALNLGMNNVFDTPKTDTGVKLSSIKYFHFKNRQLSKSTKYLYSKANELLIACFGDVDVSVFNEEYYNYFLKFLKNKKTENKNNKYTDNSISIYTRHAYCLFETLKREEIIKKNPLRFEKQIDKAPKRIPAEDLQFILNYFKNRSAKQYNIVYFALLTGFRPSTLVNLKWYQVDLKEGIIKSPNIKAKRTDEFPISAELERHLQSMPRIYGDSVFGYSDKSGLKFWSRAVKRGDIPVYQMYQLRKTFVSILRENSVPMWDVSELAGHKDIRTTKKYYTEESINKKRKILNAISIPSELTSH